MSSKLWRDAFDLHLVLKLTKRNDAKNPPIFGGYMYPQFLDAMRNGTPAILFWTGRPRAWRKWFLGRIRGGDVLLTLWKKWETT